MEHLFADILIGAGSALMIFNIVRYGQFIRHVRERGSWENETLALFVPLILLILFLLGYLAVVLFGNPDAIIAGILFGGSIFVFLIVRVMWSVTDRIRHNEELLAQLDAAEKASRAKTFFLSNMSHDIRTPLNAIIGFTTLARRNDISPEEKDLYLARIENSGQQLLGIINDVLDMSRIENGKMELMPEPVNLQELMAHSEEMFAAQMEAKKIAFFVDASGICNPWVLCDRSRFNRILLNLLSNACKFTPENGTVSAALRQTGRGDDRASYELRVKDTGIGMNPDFARNLFLPFERERTSTVSGIQGTGLGLSITKSIVDLMGGTIDVSTAPGQGTEFVVQLTFPLTEPPEDSAADGEEAECIDYSTCRLLLVEDNDINREIASLILSQSGFQLETAENGKIALEMVRASAPGYYSAILMDIQMPVMDGYEATKAIRALSDRSLAEIPIVAMTANAFREDVEKALDAGMNAHIAKPLDVSVMMSTLRAVLTK